MAHEPDDAYAAGRLLQWGLRPRERPAQEPEYLQLVNRYLDASPFKLLVQSLARGLGLHILDVGEHGLVLAPAGESAFAFHASDFRPGKTVDERLLDGLVQVAIATTIFPRARDLADDPTLARPPASIDEVEENLRTVCNRLEQAARGQPDPQASEELAGLEEAWRLYQRRLASMATKDARQAERSTRRVIEHALERLCEFGCFVRVNAKERTEYQPTWRYQVLVRDLAATTVYQAVRQALETGANG
jgi:hypothetical protein